MTKKIKKGYDWVEDQQDIWDSIAAEKLEQLNVLSQSHLEWFSKHTTIDDILSWKRPAIDIKKKIVKKEKITSEPPVAMINIPPVQESVKQIANDQSEKVGVYNSNEKSTSQRSQEAPKNCNTTPNPSADYEKLQQKPIHVDDSGLQQSDSREKPDLLVSKPCEPLKSVRMSEELNVSVSKLQTPMDVSKNTPNSDIIHPQNSPSKRASSSSTTSEGYLTADTPDLVMDLDSQKTQTQKLPKTPESYPQVEVKELSDKFKLDSCIEKDNENNISCHENRYSNEEEDEEEDEIQLVVSNRNSRKENVLEDNCEQNPTMSPITQSPISPPRNIAPTIISSPFRNQSPFMSRLFQVGSAKDRSLKEDSPSPIDFVTTRPKSSTSASTINSERGIKTGAALAQNRVEKRPSETISADIVVSDAMPFSHFKKPKILTQKTDLPKNIPSSQTKSIEKKEEAEKIIEEDIPSWSLDPELHSHLLNQAGLDPDAIFGRMTPLYLEEIFSKEFMTKIPEQAPQ